MKPTQVILDGVPQEPTFKSFKDAKAEGKRLIRKWKQTDSGSINIQYKFV